MRLSPRVVRAILTGAPGDAPGRVIHAVTQITVATATVLSHVTGALVVTVLLTFVLPHPESVEGDADVLVRNLVAAMAFTVLITPIGLRRGLRHARRDTGWLLEDRPPDRRELSRTLTLALRMLGEQTALWGIAVVVFFALNAPTSLELAVEVAITVALGGVATASVAYLLASRLRRAVVARALEGTPPQRYRVPGVMLNALTTWALCTSVPVLGMVLLAIFSLDGDTSSTTLARAVLVLGVVALAVGLLANAVLARSIADPLRALRRALRDVEAGRLDARVPVNDASEVGFVAAGFNRMVAGLNERERLRDLFGRHVGQDVARRALEQGVTLGGEEREATAVFVDVIGSTAFAASHRPTEVVDMLNDFFAIVVEETARHGGLVNKFEGDGALCVVGAPLPLTDHATSALAAARALQARLARELPAVRAGIGVSSGLVVAGNIGAADRFEYTVIGDPVNEAARLTELAKDSPGGVLASEGALLKASEEERPRWELGDAVPLRGRNHPTRLAAPHDAAATPDAATGRRHVR